jgi:hypothetical protein
MGKPPNKGNWLAWASVILVVLANIFLTGHWAGTTETKLDHVQTQLNHVQSLLEKHLGISESQTPKTAHILYWDIKLPW